VGEDDENRNNSTIICTNSSSGKTVRYWDSSVDIVPRLRDGRWTKRRSIPGSGQTDSTVHSASHQMDIGASTPGEYNDQGGRPDHSLPTWFERGQECVELNLHFPIRYCNVVINYARDNFTFLCEVMNGMNSYLLQSFTERVQKNSILYIFEKLQLMHPVTQVAPHREHCVPPQKHQRVNAVYGHNSYWR
jgi:hypothetical protein